MHFNDTGAGHFTENWSSVISSVPSIICIISRYVKSLYFSYYMFRIWINALVNVHFPITCISPTSRNGDPYTAHQYTRLTVTTKHIFWLIMDAFICKAKWCYIRSMKHRCNACQRRMSWLLLPCSCKGFLILSSPKVVCGWLVGRSTGQREKLLPLWRPLLSLKKLTNVSLSSTKLRNYLR